MEGFKLVHIDDTYRQKPENVLVRLWTQEGVCLANTAHIDSIPRDLRDRMRTLPEKVRVIILNRFILRGEEYSTLFPSAQLFPFCSVYKNGGNISLLETRQALQHGNWFLCHEKEELVLRDYYNPNTDEPLTRNGYTEYHCHVPIESAFRWKTRYPAYVNLDRDSDNIGGSSWDGNLVSWFQCGYTTRLQYASQAGLFPEE